MPKEDQITDWEYQEANVEFMLTEGGRVETLERSVARGKRGWGAWNN